MCGMILCFSNSNAHDENIVLNGLMTKGEIIDEIQHYSSEDEGDRTREVKYDRKFFIEN